MTRKKDSYNKKVVLVPGFISMRKNPSLIIEVCATVNDSIGEGLELMFAGKIQDDVLEVLDQHDFRWIGIKDDYLSRSEYLEQLQAADIVLLIYENIGSSGIVIDCLAYGIPVLILKNRFWKNLEKESEGLVKLTKKSSRKLAQDVEHMLSTNRTGNVFPCRYRSFRAMTGFDKMLQEIDN
jgi:glycosyltransferase involved in cell wall biosynthesis